MYFVDKLLKNWDSNEGLFRACIFFVGTNIPFIPFLKSIDFTTNIAIVISGIFSSSFLLIYYIVWKIKRTIVIMRKKINIVFSFYFIVNIDLLTTFLKRFEYHFYEKLKECGLEKEVEVTYLSTSKKIGSDLEAQKMLSGYVGHTLLVWGDLDNINNQIKFGKNKTSFSYEFNLVHPKNYTQKNNKEFFALLKNSFSQDINSAISSLNWDLNLNSDSDFEFYINNIYSISLLTIARILLSVTETRKSIKLLETNITRINKFKNEKEIQQHQFVLMITKMYLSELYANIANEASLKKEQINEMEKYSSLSLDNNSKNYYANMAMAFVKDKKYNDIKAALKHTLIAEQNSKGRGNIHLFNKAYLYLKIGKYGPALYLYNQLKKHGTNANIGQIVGYMEDEYNKLKMPPILFAEGYLDVIGGFNKNKGKKQLKRFIKESESDIEKYQLLRSEARKIIAEIERR